MECGPVMAHGLPTPTAMAVLAVDSRCTLGEGIVWWAARQALLWTDIQGSRLWLHSPGDGVTRTWSLPDRLGSMAICTSGALLLGLAKRLCFADLDASSGDELLVTEAIAAVDPDIPATRVNDGRTDRAGNFVFGTMNEDERKDPAGSFYQYSAAFGLRRLDLGGVHIANSICFSLDGRTMYFCDSNRRQIMRCDYDAASAGVANVREFVAFGPQQGTPDGSVIDSDDCLWNAEWGAARVRRYTIDGSLERSIALPAKNPTCVVFAGPDLEDLFITSARQEMTAEELAHTPDAGSVYCAARIGVHGVPDALFKDA
jgi:sugar lactone lactonase YvrE